MNFSKMRVYACLALGIAGAPFSAGAQTVTILHNFAGSPDGSYPLAALSFYNGLLYGAASRGGQYGDFGTIFTVDPASGKEHTVHSFTGKVGGSTPWSPLLAYDGVLYGTAEDAAISTRYSDGSLYVFDP